MDITKTIGAGKGVANLLLKINKLPEYQTIIDLMDLCSRMRIELNEKDKKIKELEEKLKNKEELEIKNNVYWNKNDGSGPFCPACLADKEIRAPMATRPGSNYATCPICKVQINFTGRENINTKKGRYY